MTDPFDQDDLPELPYANQAARAYLGCVCAGPQRVADGEWFLLVENADGGPAGFAHIGLVFDSEDAPIATAIEILRRSGYEHTQAVMTKPWAAEWRIIRPEDRVPCN
jgi:hypothetical protein